MTCKKLRARFENDPRAALIFLTDSAEYSEHLAACPECSHSVEEQKEVAKRLDLLRNCAPAISSSLDRAVLINYRRYIAEQLPSVVPVPLTSGISLRRALGWATAAAFACVVAYGEMLLFMPRQHGRIDRRLDQRPAVLGPQKEANVRNEMAAAQRPAQRRTKTIAASADKKQHLASIAEQNARFPSRFQSLMYCDQLSCPSAMDVIRLQLPSPILGVAPASARTNGLVPADVLVGPDGIARGIRVVE